MKGETGWHVLHNISHANPKPRVETRQ